MAEKKTTELTVAPTTELQQRPSWIPADHRGTEHLEKGDLQLPRLRLAQALSPQVTEGQAKYIDGLKAIDMFNDLTGQIYGRGPLQFAVIRADKPRGIQFAPRETGGGILDMDVPLNDPRMEFTADSEGKPVKPLATKFYDYVIMLLPSREVVAFSCASSAIKVAKNLNALMKLRNAPCFAGKYTVASGSETNSKGTFSVYHVKNAGWLSEEEMLYAETLFESIKDRTLVIEREPGDEPDFDPTTLEGNAAQM